MKKVCKKTLAGIIVISLLFSNMFTLLNVSATNIDNSIIELGNTSGNILNGGSIANYGDYYYYALENGLQVVNGEEEVMINDDPNCRNINVMDDTLYYTTLGEQTDSFVVKKSDLLGIDEEIIFETESEIDMMYVVNNEYIIYLQNADVYKYDFTLKQTSIESADSGVLSFIPTNYGIVYARGEYLDYNIYAGEEQVLDCVKSYYTEEDYLIISQHGEDSQIKLKKLFNGFNANEDKEEFNLNGEYTFDEVLDNSDVEYTPDEFLEKIEAEEATQPRALAIEKTESETTEEEVGAVAISQGQENIVKRARQMQEVTWKPITTINGWKNNAAYKFYAGTTYQGVPYSWPVSKGKWIGFGITVSDFKKETENASSKFYSEQSYHSDSGGSYYGPFYGNDCSTFLSYAWNLPSRKTTYSIPSISGIIKVTNTNTSALQVGDCLNCSNYHVVVISKVYYNSSGQVTGYDILEQTPPKAKKKTNVSLASISSYFSQGYIAYRHSLRDSVTYQHYCNVPIDDDKCEKCNGEGVLISDYNTVENLISGESFSIKGVVSSINSISNVTVGVYNTAGTAVLSATAAPNSTSYQISALNSKLAFNTLANGTYTYKVSATNTKETKTLVSKSFTVGAASTLALTDYTYPNAVTLGNSFVLKGIITSNYTILRMTAGIYNSQGIAESSVQKYPNSSSFSISTIDNDIKFGRLALGAYTYKVTAEDKTGTKTLLEVKFNVVATASTLAITDFTYPSSVTQGKSFSLKGTISSNYKIVDVTIGVYAENDMGNAGEPIITASATPNATSYSVKSLDSQITFGILEAGTYVYMVVATDQAGTKTLVNTRFYVVGPESTIKMTDYNYPTTMSQGDIFTVTGNITSSYDMTSVTVGILTSGGEVVKAFSAAPNATSYNLSAIDNELFFKDLAAGTYYYQVAAVDKDGSKTLLDRLFIVNATSSTLAISNYTYPQTVEEGDIFSVNGSVTSNFDISNITVGIYTTAGTTLIATAVSPNAKSYNLSNIDSYILFNGLAQGTYVYKITATDSDCTRTLTEKTFKVTKPASKLSITDYTCPSELTIGDSFKITGKITSNYTMSNVTVGIYTETGGDVSIKSVNPRAMSYNLTSIDSSLMFSMLAAGKYVYKVIATDEQGEKTLVSNTFTVTMVPSELAIKEYNYPTTFVIGNEFLLQGIVTSNYNISNITVAILTTEGETVISTSASPNAESYDLSNIDSYFLFLVLTEGDYIYRVNATDPVGTKTLVEKAFKVGEFASYMELTDREYPTTLEEGEVFSPKGTVISKLQLTNVTVSVYTSANVLVQQVSKTVSGTTYNLNQISGDTLFKTLKAGNYIYRVFSTDTLQTNCLLEETFTVTKATSRMELTNREYPTTLEEGEVFSPKGTVISKQPLTNVTVAVYTAANVLVQKVSNNVSGTTYNLNQISGDTLFKELKAGNYIYRVFSTDTLQTNCLLEEMFTVTVTSVLTITDYTKPKDMVVGTPLGIKGEITSNYNITGVTVGVYTTDGKAKIEQTENPNATSYNVRAVNSKISFGSLLAGEYIYKITATNEKETKVLVEQPFAMVKSVLNISDYTVPKNMPIGTPLGIKGAINSEYTILKVTVGVYTKSGEAKLLQTGKPNATNYNVRALNSGISFGKLAQGDYVYKIVATDSKETKVLLETEFSIYQVTGGLSIKDYTVPKNMLEGTPLGIKGEINSEHNISKVTVGVYTTDGKAKMEQIATPNDTTYNVRALNSGISFGKLAAGNYVYKVIATDAKETKTLVEAKFSVT